MVSRVADTEGFEAPPLEFLHRAFLGLEGRAKEEAAANLMVGLCRDEFRRTEDLTPGDFLVRNGRARARQHGRWCRVQCAVSSRRRPALVAGAGSRGWQPGRIAGGSGPGAPWHAPEVRCP